MLFVIDIVIDMNIQITPFFNYSTKEYDDKKVDKVFEVPITAHGIASSSPDNNETTTTTTTLSEPLVLAGNIVLV